MVKAFKENVHKHVKSHAYAWNGVYLIFASQLNFRIELFITILVIIAGFYFNISLAEWYGVVFSCALVLLAEALNSALEKACDAITTKHHGAIRYAKDVAAGAVLLAAAGAIVIGVIVFGPHVKALFGL